MDTNQIRNKCVARNIERQCRESIMKKLESIKDIDTLESIDNFIEDSKPLDLKTYIDIHFDDYHEEVKKALEHEVRETWLDINNRFEPNDGYINHFCELYVQGHELDIWIHENGSLFNSCEIAIIIFKLWTKEIVFR